MQARLKITDKSALLNWSTSLATETTADSIKSRD